MKFIKSSGLKIYLSERDKEQLSSPERIAKAMFENGVLAFDIYDNELLVGFVMLRQFSEYGFFLWDFAIDSRLQNNHYGEKALKELLYILSEKYQAKLVTTTYKYGNTHARHIYEKVGFTETDTVAEDDIYEVNMEINL